MSDTQKRVRFEQEGEEPATQQHTPTALQGREKDTPTAPQGEGEEQDTPTAPQGEEQDTPTAPQGEEMEQEQQQEQGQEQDKGELPINWPTEIRYLRQPQTSPLINPLALKLVNKPTAAAINQARFSIDSILFPNPRVRITPIRDPTHPSNHQYGLFALRPFAPNSFILPYLGRLHSDAPNDTDTSSRYDISLDRELGLSIDATKAGNEARFVNDYRNIKDKPNAEFRDCWVKTASGKWERWIGIFVLSVGNAGLRKRGIKPGDEILVSYGKGFWKE